MPDQTTLEGAIYHANEVLQDALGPKVKGIPHELFDECKGLAILNVVEVGVVFSGSTGSGVLLKKNAESASGWSAPVAVSTTGSSFGALVGGSEKHVICFLMSDEAIQKVLEKKGLSLNSFSMELSAGFGRAKPFGLGGLKHKAIPIVFCQGSYIGLGLQGVVLAEQSKSNQAFYGEDVSLSDVLEGKVAIPENKTTMIENIYSKLNGPLAHGEAVEGPTPEEEAKKSEAFLAAEEAAVEANKGDDVVHIDASKETSTKAPVTA